MVTSGRFTAAMRGARLRYFMLILLFGWLSLCARLVDMQIVRHSELLSIKERQMTRTSAVRGRRGTIYDRDGVILAESKPDVSLYMVPYDSTEILHIADYVDHALRIGDWGQAVAPRPNTRSWIKRFVGGRILADLSDSTGHFDINSDYALSSVRKPPYSGAPIGIFFQGEYRRDYNETARNVMPIGVSSFDGVGTSGVEAFFDSVLRATSGSVRLKQDATGRGIMSDTNVIAEVKHGRDVSLSLSLNLQSAVMRAFRRLTASLDAVQVMAVALNSHTGEYLLLADYDPTRTTADDQDDIGAWGLMKDSNSFEMVPAAFLFLLGEAMDGARLVPEDLIVDTLDAITLLRNPNLISSDIIVKIAGSCSVGRIQRVLESLDLPQSSLSTSSSRNDVGGAVADLKTKGILPRLTIQQCASLICDIVGGEEVRPTLLLQPDTIRTKQGHIGPVHGTILLNSTRNEIIEMLRKIYIMVGPRYVPSGSLKGGFGFGSNERAPKRSWGVFAGYLKVSEGSSPIVIVCSVTFRRDGISASPIIIAGAIFDRVCDEVVDYLNAPQIAD